MSTRNASHMPRQAYRGPKRRLTNRLNIRPMATSHLVPSMGPIVPVLTSHGWQNQL